MSTRPKRLLQQGIATGCSRARTEQAVRDGRGPLNAITCFLPDSVLDLVQSAGTASDTRIRRYCVRCLVDLKVQQELLRHSDIRTTMNIYTQAVLEAMREANSKVFEMVLPLRKVG